MSYKQCYEFRSIPTGTDGIFRTGMQIGTGIASVPPWIKFRPISASFGHSGQFRPKCNFCLE